MISLQLTEITRKTHNTIFTIYILLVSEISKLPFQNSGLPGKEKAYQTFDLFLQWMCFKSCRWSS